MSAEHTVGYFDEHCPEYSPARVGWAADWLRERHEGDGSLADVGCGSGNILAYMRERTGIDDVTGIDPSQHLLSRAAATLGCPTYAVSVLDPSIGDRVPRRFDVVLLAAVLHHLVGGTRSASRRLAQQGLANALSLVRPGGHLLVVEPVFYPRAPVSALFYVKRAVSVATDRRVPLGGYWNNIGPPVVSYLTEDELTGMAARAGGTVTATHRVERPLPAVVRAAGIRRRLEASVVVRRPAW